MLRFIATSGVNSDSIERLFVLGISAGLCGCLSTVSTWISELVITVKPLPAVYAYGVLTILTVTTLASLVYGAFVWTYH